MGKANALERLTPSRYSLRVGLVLTQPVGSAYAVGMPQSLERKLAYNRERQRRLGDGSPLVALRQLIPPRLLAVPTRGNVQRLFWTILHTKVVDLLPVARGQTLGFHHPRRAPARTEWANYWWGVFRDDTLGQGGFVKMVPRERMEEMAKQVAWMERMAALQEEVRDACGEQTAAETDGR